MCDHKNGVSKFFQKEAFQYVKRALECTRPREQYQQLLLLRLFNTSFWTNAGCIVKCNRRLAEAALLLVKYTLQMDCGELKNCNNS
jgi:hypothetical protein